MSKPINDRQYGPQYKLIGKNYATADLYAKVTGKVEIRRRLSRRRHAVLQAACSARCRMRG